MTNELEQLVEDVAQLTGAARPEWMGEDSPALRLEQAGNFYLVGLIGGKEVGKTALVNALAGQQLSAPTGFGRGTEIAIAYAHESQVAEVRALLENEAPGRFQIVWHKLAHLTSQVLLDLPDVDSRYGEHLELTRRMLRHMLFPIWIQSVEKYADQQPQKLLAAVAQGNDPSNFVFVLNKADQLPAAQSDELRADYAQRIGRVLKLPAAPKVLLISAIRPEQFELPRLRQMLAQEKSSQDVQRSMQLAVRQRQRSILSWVRQQELPQRVERLQRLQDEAEEMASARLGEPLIDQVIPEMLDDPGYRLTLIEDVMNRRVARWPLVNLVHTLLAPLASLYRISAAPAAISVGSLVEHHLGQVHPPLVAAIQSMFATLHQTHPQVAELYRTRRLWEATAAESATTELGAAMSSAIASQRQYALDRLTGRFALLAPWRWLLTIGALLWFPFVQPILEVVLQHGIIAVNREALLLIVKIFSAAYLLQAAGFLLIWFVFLWAYLRWDTSRRVNRLLMKLLGAGESTPGDAMNLAAATLMWIDDLLDPIRQARQRIAQLAQRAEKLDSDLAAAA